MTLPACAVQSHRRTFDMFIAITIPGVDKDRNDDANVNGLLHMYVSAFKALLGCTDRLWHAARLVRSMCCFGEGEASRPEHFRLCQPQTLNPKRANPKPQTPYMLGLGPMVWGLRTSLRQPFF